MSIWPRRLSTRLFLSYLVVIVTGAGTMLIVGTVVTRSVYENRLGGFGFGRTQGRRNQVSNQVTEAELQTALDESLLPALAAGSAAALVAAVLVAWFVGRRLLRPLDEVRDATKRMAAGDYTVEVPVPAETELASLARDVNELGDHLATTERRRSQLLGEVTHELRTPITVIRGQMEGLVDRVIEPSDEVYVAIADEAARLQRLVDDLTTLSRADEGALEIAPVDLDLGRLAVRAAERLRPQFDHEGVRLVADDPDASLVVRADSDRITQVVTNLIGNALGHTPAGGTVTIRSGREGHTAWIDVVDTGDGIAPDDLEHIFDRFYRGEASTTGRPRAGRGIGLTIARSLARAHGGDVVAVSAGRGQGATFRLTVPTADAGQMP